MSEATQNPAPRKKATSLSTMLLADLKALAGGLGIDGSSSMKKAQLVEAIKQYQDSHSSAPRASKPDARAEAPATPEASAQLGDQAQAPVEEKPKVTTRARGQNRAERTSDQSDAAAAPRSGSTPEEAADAPQGRSQRRRRGQDESVEAPESAPSTAGSDVAAETEGGERRGRNRNRTRDRQQGEAANAQDNQQGQGGHGQGSSEKQNQGEGQPKQKKANVQNQNGQQNNGPKNEGQGQNNGQNQTNAQKNDAQKNDGLFDDEFDEDGGSRRNRRRRGRERTDRPGRNEPDTTILDDDVLVPAAGILDVLDNYAFVRTSGYLPGPDDVYLSLSMVRKYGLRRGDAVVGQVRQPREGERREKFNPMVRIDSVNGLDPEAGKERPEFDAFVPVHPNTRLRLETGPDNLLGRIVDVLAPIGKGQRGMVLSPPRSGKTQVLQTIAAAIRHNNPECHVMVVLIDERPEEVTDYQRTVRGEVVASTFDRPAADHVLLAELAVERAKRLVEMGHDVVVLLDSLTRLARAFNVTSPGSGRQGAGGVDPVALHPAKRLFGAARNVEDGGSLTILATALVDSGSPLDEAVLDEFNDTGNMDLRLRRELVERRIFPPVDVVASGTRREEQLLSAEEQALTFKLRSALDDLDPRDALERVVARMTATATNVEFLAQVQKASIAELSGK